VWLEWCFFGEFVGATLSIRTLSLKRAPLESDEAFETMCSKSDRNMIVSIADVTYQPIIHPPKMQIHMQFDTDPVSPG
jgi:hypothetical protein